MKYRVGQVLYVVLKRETRVYPMQVVEEITKKTLDGEVTSYMVRGGSDPKAQLLISEVDGEIFDSAEKAKSVLIDRATGSIVRLMDAAVQKAKEWYPGSFEAPSDDPLSLLKKTPQSSPKPPAPQRAPSDALSELAAELQAESAQIAGEDATLITLPDGSKAKVNSIKLPDPLQ
jgi:hypothetical protein